MFLRRPIPSHMKIIGITGTIGAGKGSIVNYLVTHYGYKHYSVREYLIREAQKRDLPLNRDTYVELANHLRKIHSPSYIIDELYNEAAGAGVDAVIESIRTPGEIASLRAKGNFTLWAVDADPKKRYDRISARQSETDQISFDIFLANEQREMNTEDITKQNLTACIKQADVLFDNNGSIDTLFQQIEVSMEKHL